MIDLNKETERLYGIGNYVGDSYGLSLRATEHPAQKIVFCLVYFMGETAKLRNPDKEVLVPRVAGCSLAGSITGELVRALRIEIPLDIAARAKRNLDRMFELEKEGKALLAERGKSALPWTV